MTARALVLKGLLEALVLLVVERGPLHGYGILKEIEETLGEAPTKSQIYGTLQELQDEGLVESEEVEADARSKQEYHLTPEGASRLDRFRTLPPEFKAWLADLFGLGEGPPAESTERARPQPERRPRSEEDEEGAWVPARLRDLPTGPSVQAPFASVSIDRSPREGSWSLRVENHEPAGYEGSEVCPLTFLYLAAQQLLFEPGDRSGTDGR